MKANHKEKFKIGEREVEIAATDVRVEPGGDLVAKVRVNLSAYGRELTSAWHADNLVRWMRKALEIADHEQRGLLEN